MKQSESIANLAAALATVQQHITPVVKDRQNPHFKNNYATLDAIMESVRPLLAGHGLSIVQGGGSPVSNADGNIVGAAVETMLVHSSGEFITSAIVLPLDKATPQAVGSAITYGRRYGVAALLALSTEEDDDGNTASAPRSAPLPQRASAPQPTPAAAPAAGAARAAHAKLMPFGKKKGTPLGDLSIDELVATIAWANKTDAAKFADLVADCQTVVNSRHANGVPA